MREGTGSASYDPRCLLVSTASRCCVNATQQHVPLTQLCRIPTHLHRLPVTHPMTQQRWKLATFEDNWYNMSALIFKRQVKFHKLYDKKKSFFPLFLALIKVENSFSLSNRILKLANQGLSLDLDQYQFHKPSAPVKTKATTLFGMRSRNTFALNR